MPLLSRRFRNPNSTPQFAARRPRARPPVRDLALGVGKGPAKGPRSALKIDFWRSREKDRAASRTSCWRRARQLGFDGFGAAAVFVGWRRHAARICARANERT
jgi:hypothetical protein